jgi:hypothetical protein
MSILFSPPWPLTSLSISGMSPEIECIFSQAGRLIITSRNGLSDEIIEACQVQ